MIDLSSAQLAEVQAILAKEAPECEVWVFGSRVHGTPKTYSDLDLAVIGPKPLGVNRMGRLREAFTHSDLSIRVDVLDWHAVPESFRAHITRNHAVLIAPPAVSR